jgi:hypothetical protein
MKRFAQGITGVSHIINQGIKTNRPVDAPLMQIMEKDLYQL